MKRQIIRSVLPCLTALLCFSGCGNTNDSPEESGSVEAGSEMVSEHIFEIDYGNPTAEIQPTMYGIFFEDINFAADGGIYAEMVKNRSFEFTLPMMGWEQPQSDRWSMNDQSGFASVVKRSSGEPNSHFLRVKTNAESGFTLTNTGFRGMGVKEGLTYNLTIDARVMEGNPELTIELVDSSNNVLGGTTIVPKGDGWSTYEAGFNATATEKKAHLRISVNGTAVFDIDMVSLFPSDTWMDRPKGMRKDLVQKLADLDPGFLRFPGGCIVEGRTLDRRYQWKKTVGDIDDREFLVNRWNTEFAHRPTPDYYQSFGLGFFEYFQLSEDMGAEPLPILSCGIACQFNTGELVPMDELDPYIDDALDLIEFANGSVTSEWGKLRADMGHPEPFNMKYIGIGNEQWGPEYIIRYRAFEEALKAKYPEIIIVSGSGPFPDGEMFDYGMAQLKDTEIIDEHYYRPPAWFRENADRYDDYDRNGPKIFAGEYAAQSVAIASPDNKNNWECALSEAAFITGLERNADIVHLTSYAPLFAHEEGWQWTPDLIWFNNLESYGTPNYAVQKLYSTNRGSHVLNLTENGEPLIGQDGLYATASKLESTNELIIKIVNVTSAEQTVNVDTKTSHSATGLLTVLQSDNLEAENSFENPDQIAPQASEIEVGEGIMTLNIKPQSMNVLRVSMN